MNSLCKKVHITIFLLWSLVGVSGFAPAAEPDPRDASPRSLIITYHTLPANRSALRSYMQASGLKDFAQWKQQGALSDYHVYFNRYVDSDNWDMLAIVTLASGNGTERWKKIEAGHPAGLSEKILALTTAINTAPADLVRAHATDAKAVAGKPAVYLMVPYDYLVSLGEYLKYVDAYLVPQVEGWMQEGILTSYGLYLSRYPAGRPWSAFVVYEYGNEDALGARDVVMAKVRARLKDNSEWKAVSDSKHNVRAEKQPVVADELTAY
jgi:hypothetical protein